MINSIFKKKGVALLVLLLCLIGTSAIAQTTLPPTANTSDYDGDGVPNNIDDDDDNDGILDVDEYDCTLSPSDLIWGVPIWSGTGDPDDETEIDVTTTINSTEVSVTNTGTDFAGNPGLDILEGSVFNGKNGLLINAVIGELIGTSIVYTVSFNRPVIGLNFSVIDIDFSDGTIYGAEYKDQVTVTVSNGAENLTLIKDMDYTVPNSTIVDDIGGGVFQGLQLIGNTNTTDADVIFNINQPVDKIVVEFTNVATVPSTLYTAISISDFSWTCAFRDVDSDTLADHFDTDSDGDTCPDALEGDGGFALADIDADNSLGDTVDANGIPTTAGTGQADVSSTDNTTTSGVCDDDGDGVINSTDGANSLSPCLPEQSAGYTGYDATNTIWADGDCDLDGILNGDEVGVAPFTDPYDPDTDGDGEPDNVDTAPLSPCLPEQSAGYTEYDATNTIWAGGDCDLDGILNGDEVGVAPFTDPYNPDTDGDGEPDNVDTAPLSPCLPEQSAGYTGYDATNTIWAGGDCDLDGILNGDEVGVAPFTDPYNPDTDGDGEPDNVDTAPLSPCLPEQSAGYTGYDATNTIWAGGDCDLDGILNGDEVGVTPFTDPYNPDTDGDGEPDNVDTAPLSPCLPEQSAGYTGYDATNTIWADGDCDLDGILNGDEVGVAPFTDPYNPDTDGDGEPDNVDTDPLSPCLPEQSAGYTGYDATNTIWAGGDCDLDGILNGDEVGVAPFTDPYNPDTDGDGEPDVDTAPLSPCLPEQSAGYTGYDATNTIWAGGDCDLDGILNGDEVGVAPFTDPYNPDTDGDGEPDNVDTAPLSPCLPEQSAGYTGYDATNTIWAGGDCDLDGILNGDEVGVAPFTDPYNPDTDGDGEPDNVDTAPLSPCLPEQSAGYTGYDATNTIWAGGDCDLDGILNGDEVGVAPFTDPYNPDTDGDGEPDNVDTAPLSPCLPEQSAGYTGYDMTNAIWAAADCDSDGLTNSLEITNGTDPYLFVDTDGDGIDDDNEVNNGTDPSLPCDPVQSAGYADYDSGNATWAAADCDGDGVINGDEVANGTDPYEVSADTDGDGIDDDNEVNNGTDPSLPCDPVQSAGYADYDSGNATWAAADCDGDGVINGDEVANGTDPYGVSVDTDGDGIDDDNEVNNGTDPSLPCDPAQSVGYTGYDATNTTWAAADCDGDGIANGTEDTNGTDPYLASGDTDGDGINDDNEVNNGTDPNDPCDPSQDVGYTGYDATNAIWAEADCDRDSLTNSEEIALGTDVYNADTDGDTINDGQEVSDGTDPFDDCDSIGGTPLPDSFCDRDNDGLSDEDEIINGTDPDDPDSDGDTIEDGVEVADGTDPLDPCDSNGGTPPQGVICGVEISNSILTPDGDGVNDFFNIDNIGLYANNSVEIINRWGAVVYKTENYNNTSNVFAGIANTGTSLNKGNILPAGVYFYVIKYVDEGESKTESGYLYINQ